MKIATILVFVLSAVLSSRALGLVRVQVLTVGGSISTFGPYLSGRTLHSMSGTTSTRSASTATVPEPRASDASR